MMHMHWCVPMSVWKIGNGTDIVIESASIILMRNDLNEVATAIQLSKATLKILNKTSFGPFIIHSAFRWQLEYSIPFLV